MDSGIHTPRANPPIPHIRCLVEPSIRNSGTELPTKHKTDDRLRLAHRALLITEVQNSRNGQKIRFFLSSLRIDVKVELKSRTLPALSNKKSGRFAVIVFESYNSYLDMDSWNRQLIDKYCHDYHVGIIGFVKPLEDTVGVVRHVDGYHITFQYNLELEDYKLNTDSAVWRAMRPGEAWRGFLPDKWTVFHSNHNTYQPLAFSKLSSNFLEFDTGETKDLQTFKYVTAVLDLGKIDGISKILLGNDLSFWLHTVVMVDALSYLSFGKLELQLERYIQVDVDDIFVGKEGIRMKVSDVEVSHKLHKSECFHLFVYVCILSICQRSVAQRKYSMASLW